MRALVHHCILAHGHACVEPYIHARSHAAGMHLHAYDVECVYGYVL